MCKFCHIHAHSEFSALDGLLTCAEMADRAIELGCEAVGITDHGTVAGHLEFARVLSKKGIKPIFGAELYHASKPKGYSAWNRNERDQAHFVVGAMTNEGLKNLWRLVDSASTNFRYVGRNSWEDLAKYKEGVFATSACMAGMIPQGLLKSDLTAFNKYIEIYKDNFYIELHTYPGPEQEQVNLMLTQIGQERGIPFVFASDAHFAFPNQYAVHDAYVAMQVGESIDTPLADRSMWHPMALYMMDEIDIRNALHYLPQSVVDEALTNTSEIADKCDVKLPEVRRHLPVFVPADSPYVASEDKDISAAKLFIDLVQEGVINRYGEDAPEEVWDRASREMGVFLSAEIGLDGGLSHYFLQAWDFCCYCDQEDIMRGPGRGSAAGSLVAYCLGITDIDPIFYKLSFERFYNPGRTEGFPDIDTDFPKGDRVKIKEYLAQRWGTKNVRSIGNVIRMKPKAALDKTYGAMGVTWAEKEAIKKIVSTVPDLEILGSDSVGWKNDGTDKTIYIWDHVGGLIQRYVDAQAQNRRPILNRWLDFLNMVCSRVLGYGVHASGVVVSDGPLNEELPCMWSATQECQATVFPMKEVEKRQFVKQDILGLRTLDTLQDWRKQVNQTQGIDVIWSGLEMKEHPIEMWEMLDQGLATGIFQIEDKTYVRQLAMDFKPRSIEDLSIIVALNRPGPIRSGAPDSFVARRRGTEAVVYDLPFLEDILDQTYGWFLYQEQVISLFSKMGYSESDADAVRKILGKKKPEDMRKLRRGEGEWSGKGYDFIAPSFLGSATEIIWKKLEDFAKYSFNLSHSIAYATIGFRTLYAKYYAPAEFFMACIRTNSDDAALYVAEARRMGITILPPDIQKSISDVNVADGSVYFGLSNIKGVGVPTAEYIVGLGQTYHLSGRQDLESALATEKKQWEARKLAHKNSDNSARFKELSPNMIVKSNVIDALQNAGAFDNYEERSATMAEMQKHEKELLGIILTDNVQEAFDTNADLIEECDAYADLLDSTVDITARLPGTIVNIRPVKTRATGNDMAIVKIEWGQETVEFAVFPQQWKAYKFMWRERVAGIFTLKKTERGINFDDGIKLS